MSIESIFGANPPGVTELYTDGSPSILLAQDFTTYGGLLPDAQCVGGRVYVPTLEQPHTSLLTIKAWLVDDLTAAPLREKVVPVTATGWVEATWDEPFDMPGDGQRVRIGYQFTGSEVGVYRYVHTAEQRPDANAILSPTLEGLELMAAPSTFFRVGTGSQSTAGSALSGYGIDILVEGEAIEIGPPPNQIPVANAGPNKSAYVGQQVTLTGAGSDADGTVASYAWSQTAGPTVVLAGSGAARTFTPTVVGSYTFTLVVTDDDGEQSVPDSVTVNILAVPAEPDPEPEPSTTSSLRPFPMIEKALKELLATKLEIPAASVGGDLSFDASVDDFYVWLGLVSGQTTAVDGYWTIDIDVFDQHYAQAMTRALAIEAALLGRGGHRTSLMRLDNVSQNEVPMERPWEDDNAYRIGATYTFVARRSG